MNNKFVIVSNDDKRICFSDVTEDIAVVGDWNGWGRDLSDRDRLFPDSNNLKCWVAGYLEPGWYSYKYLKNGIIEMGENRRLLVLGDNYVEKRPVIEYSNNDVKSVSVVGSFNSWAGIDDGKFVPKKYRMLSGDNGNWEYDVSSLPPGRYEYKLVCNDTDWIGGDNNIFYINAEGKLYNPFSLIKGVFLNDFDTIDVLPNYHLQSLKDISIDINNSIDLISQELISIDNQSVIRLKISNIDISLKNSIIVKGIYLRPLLFDVQPGQVFDKIKSDIKLGVIYDSSENSTIFRIFAPRTSRVTLAIYDDSNESNIHIKQDLMRLDNGVWETTIWDDLGYKYYRYFIDGPMIDGDDFDYSRPITDPYAVSSATGRGPGIIVNIRDFEWTDNNWVTPKHKDLIIYEAHVRDLTMDDSSLVREELRGTYLGLSETAHHDSGVGYLKKLGVNTIELLPVHEFDDFPDGKYHWGYMTSLFFSPETSYASNPEDASNIKEFKTLVNTLHSNDMAVIMDVVYNHSGGPHYFAGIDRKYYYRLNDNLTYKNFSGCGNDIKTENYMVSRLIIDSLLFFVEEYHIDGFRFDLAELIDINTLMNIQNTLRTIKPDIILIAEPWSFRGTNKWLLRGSYWSAWNDDFRNRVKDFVTGSLSAIELVDVIQGSTNIWTENHLQSVNYVESHDDMTVIDEICERVGNNTFNPSRMEKKMDMLSALLIFTSKGIPMISGGQEFLRSKNGSKNSYDSGDELNSLKYNLAIENKDVFDFYKNLIYIRNTDNGEFFKNNDSQYRFIFSDSSNSFGYLIDTDKVLGKRAILILINRNRTSAENINIFLDTKFKLLLDFHGLYADSKDVLNEGDNNIIIESLVGKVYISV